MKKFYLACLALLLPHLMQAQTSTCASDTLLFRECFSDSVLKTDVELMRKVYNNILHLAQGNHNRHCKNRNQRTHRHNF